MWSRSKYAALSLTCLLNLAGCSSGDVLPGPVSFEGDIDVPSEFAFSSGPLRVGLFAFVQAEGTTSTVSSDLEIISGPLPKLSAGSSAAFRLSLPSVPPKAALRCVSSADPNNHVSASVSGSVLSCSSVTAIIVPAVYVDSCQDGQHTPRVEHVLGVGRTAILFSGQNSAVNGTSITTSGTYRLVELGESKDISSNNAASTRLKIPLNFAVEQSGIIEISAPTNPDATQAKRLYLSLADNVTGYEYGRREVSVTSGQSISLKLNVLGSSSSNAPDHSRFLLPVFYEDADGSGSLSKPDKIVASTCDNGTWYVVARVVPKEVHQAFASSRAGDHFGWNLLAIRGTSTSKGVIPVLERRLLSTKLPANACGITAATWKPFDDVFNTSVPSCPPKKTTALKTSSVESCSTTCELTNGSCTVCTPGLSATLWLGADKKYDAPVVFVEGFDPNEERDQTWYFNYLKPLIGPLLFRGYDLWIINLNDGDASLKTNGKALFDFLKYSGTYRGSNSPKSISQTVIGHSMGGLLARYALVLAEVTGQQHYTDVLMTMDSPHSGAHINLDLQMIARVGKKNVGLDSDFAKESLFYYLHPNGYVVPDFTEALKLNNAQWYPRVNSGGWTTNAPRVFYLEYTDSAGTSTKVKLGYPQKTINIAVSFGASIAKASTQSMINYKWEFLWPLSKIVPNGSGSKDYKVGDHGISVDGAPGSFLPFDESDQVTYGKQTYNHTLYSYCLVPGIDLTCIRLSVDIPVFFYTVTLTGPFVFIPTSSALDGDPVKQTSSFATQANTYVSSKNYRHDALPEPGAVQFILSRLPTRPGVTDNDKDGFEALVDCYDDDPMAYPGAAERCNNKDDNCDGLTDNDLECKPGQPLGICINPCGITGTKTCGSSCIWLPCTYPPEKCDSLDQDCDGSEANGFQCGPPGVYSACVKAGGTLGARLCGTTCQWGGCENYCDSLKDTEKIEVCDGMDNDCDGMADEDSSGKALEKACYTGTFGTENVGACHGGKRTCYSGKWGFCVGEVVPTKESCTTKGIDDDCDGEVDEENSADCQWWSLDKDEDGEGVMTVTDKKCLCKAEGLYSAPYCDPTAPSCEPDCYDGNANAFHGQTKFFKIDRGDWPPSYDYDCNGKEEHQHKGVSDCWSDWGVCKFWTANARWSNDGSCPGEPTCGQEGCILTNYMLQEIGSSMTASLCLCEISVLGACTKCVDNFVKWKQGCR